MSRIITIIILAILLPAFLACSSEKKGKTEASESRQTQNAVTDTTKATCPGCGMEMAKSEMITYITEGKTLYFCSEHCRKNYLASVEKNSVVPPSTTP